MTKVRQKPVIEAFGRKQRFVNRFIPPLPNGMMWEGMLSGFAVDQIDLDTKGWVRRISYMPEGLNSPQEFRAATEAMAKQIGRVASADLNSLQRIANIAYHSEAA